MTVEFGKYVSCKI